MEAYYKAKKILLEGQQGPKGDPGPMGPQGPQGPAGTPAPDNAVTSTDVRDAVVLTQAQYNALTSKVGARLYLVKE